MATRLLRLVFRGSIGTGRHPDSVARRRGQAVALLMLAMAAAANGDPVADKSVHLAADKPARIQPLPALREQAVERGTGYSGGRAGFTWCGSSLG